MIGTEIRKSYYEDISGHRISFFVLKKFQENAVIKLRP